MPSRSRGRQSLTNGLDKEVYQVVRKIIDERSQSEETLPRLTAALVYNEISRSNSSLNRKPKKLLEGSLERILATIQHDIEESDSEADVDGAQTAEVILERPLSNGLNRSIVGAWSNASNAVSKRDREPQAEAVKGVAVQGEAVSKKRQPNGEPPPKKQKVATMSIDHSPPTHVSFDDFGGIESVTRQFKELLVLPMTRPELYISSRTKYPRGILLYGPPGCGKTMLANVFAAELGVSFISVSAPSVVSGMSGESEKALREYFDEAKRHAPCLLFIDEIDAITPKRENTQRDMEKRIVAQLITCMDDLDPVKTDGKPVIVMATANRPDSLDSALRRGGRFDNEINMQIPNAKTREQILRAQTRKVSLTDDMDFPLLAQKTPGFVGADLEALVSAAGTAAIWRVLSILETNAQSSEMDLDNNDNAESDAPGLADHTVPISTSQSSTEVMSVRKLIRYAKQTQNMPDHEDTSSPDAPTIRLTMQDFLTSLPKVQPSTLREGFATIPSTTFGSIGALSTHISELQETIIRPILNPTLYSSVGITPSSGALLWGPPGCGKTLLAKAVANSSHANFISVKGSELLNKYVGESERAVRQVFTRARSSVPVIIFFDEVDALAPRRDSSNNEASSRVVSTLLTELDGVGQSREGIYIIAATNRPDMIDAALLRPGRLESMLFVRLPDAEGRVDILRTQCKKLNNFTWTEDIADIARSCEGFSGADLEHLLRRATYIAIRRCTGDHDTTAVVTVADFHVAQMETRRSVSDEDMERYDYLQEKWGKTTRVGP